MGYPAGVQVGGKQVGVGKEPTQCGVRSTVVIRMQFMEHHTYLHLEIRIRKAVGQSLRMN